MLSDALKMLRVFSQQTQSALAGELGISKSYLSEIESGKKAPPLDLIDKYSKVYDIPSSQILLFSEKMAKESTSEKVRAFSAKQILRFMQWISDDNDAHERCKQ